MSNKLPLYQETEQTSQNKQPWYKEGLSFKCTGCGMCCTGEPGAVWVNEEEILKISSYLKLSVEEFAKKYLRIIEKNFSLKEKNSYPHDCLFLKENKCSIYPVRPKQCRTFPWWIENIESKKAWEEAKKNCEGIRDDAPTVSMEEIHNQLNV